MPFLRWIYRRAGQFVCWFCAWVALMGAVTGFEGSDDGVRATAAAVFAGFAITGAILRGTMILRSDFATDQA